MLEGASHYNFGAFWVSKLLSERTDKMAAKAVQGVVAQVSALSPAFAVRIGSRGYSK